MQEGIRIAKFIAQNGYCSRRKAEELIEARSVKLNGEIISNPATHITGRDIIEIQGEILKKSSDNHARLWLYYKPNGLITSHKDTHSRTTIFETLPKNLPRVISVGRLDLNSEGLLLLTNSGKLARYLELPVNALARVYKVRAFGQFDLKELVKIEKGITIDGITYKPARIELIKGGANSWFSVTLSEGKNREIRKIFSHFNLSVNRLIRIKYGPFEIEKLEPGELKEVPYKKLLNYLPQEILAL
ncbi:MAG: pseudouridine synthase [Rickettsiaceae bacterium]|jgi:23S rRNA pseudouridine2605 synthase|nr:pseudouridine synthase [Rickettsiaceae bacterium]